MQIVNIAAYKFIQIPDPQSWRAPLKECCDRLALKGTILIAGEGINLFIAGERAAVDQFLSFLRYDKLFGQRFSDLTIKESLSQSQPFGRMRVRLKKEIITMHHPTIKPEAARAPSVQPQLLKTWLDQGHDDDGREIVLLDTRNAFEVEVGTFAGALTFDIERFSQFPQAIANATSGDQQAIKDKTIVSFCTGGIRCEKAALYMNELDLPHVFQLDGGILRYFEEVGGAHWQGQCFVFDERFALDPRLRETTESKVRTSAQPK